MERRWKPIFVKKLKNLYKMGEVLPKRREVFIDMIYVMFGLMAFTMIFNLACLILSLIAVFGILFYMRPPKSWGRLLWYSGYTKKEKAGIGLIWLVFMVLIFWNVIDGSMRTASADFWLRTVTVVLLLIERWLPVRIFERGFRDYLKFETWEDIESIEILENSQVKVHLKEPGVRKYAYFRLKPRESLPEVCREKMRSL